MSSPALPIAVPRPVAKKVSRLRLMVRVYALLEGLAALAIVLGAAFWLGLAIDWLLEPNRSIRVTLWAAVLLAAGWVAWRYLIRRLAAPLPDDSLALLVERQYPDLGESFVTAVQTSRGREVANQPYARRLFDATSRRAAAAMPGIQLRRIFNPRPLVRKGAAALALLASMAAMALLYRDAFAFYLQRLKLSEELWPRRVYLTVVGFEDRDGSAPVNVARDDEFELTVLASLKDGHVAPDEVEIRWRRPSDGGRGGGPMLRIGDARPGQDDAQQYRYAFKVASDLEFDVIGGDDRIRNLRLRAVERPAVTRVALETTFPDYMQRDPRTIPVSGRAELPEGATAVCRIEANKPLRSVEVRDSLEQSDLAAKVSAEDPRTFSFPLEASVKDRLLLVTMHDADGVSNREPFRLPLSTIPDQPPEASIQLRGIGTAVTPQAIIPFAGKVTDDYALAEAWFDYRIGEDASRQRPLRTQPTGLPEFRMTESLDLAEADPATSRPLIELKPGQKFSLAVVARDAYNLGDAPHLGSSQRFLLDVVTPSELRALLERRELSLRQRFEAIHDKMVGVRELLDRIDAAATLEPQTAADGAEPPTDADAARLRQRDLSRLSSARQSAAQLAFETTGVATGFDDIVAELINNRVDTEELKQRLETGISEPLKTIGSDLLPGFDRRLETLQSALDAAVETAEPLAAAKSEADAVLEAMQAVLDRMLELESYNELVELLRGILADQEQLRERTQQEQKAKLRSLLED